MNNNRLNSRLFGVFFIISFLAYGIGNSLLMVDEGTASLTDTLQSRFLIGGILMSLVHTLTNTSLVVIAHGWFRKLNPTLANGYLGLGLLSTMFLAMGGVVLLGSATVGGEVLSQTVFDFGSQTNFFAYQMGMAIWSIVGFLLCYLLLKGNFVPKWLPIWGYVGYAIFLVGILLELAGFSYGVAMSIPGGLFEITLSVWVIWKGVRKL